MVKGIDDEYQKYQNGNSDGKLIAFTRAKTIENTLDKYQDELWPGSSTDQRRGLRQQRTAADELLARMKSDQTATAAKHSGTSKTKLGLSTFDGDPMKYYGWIKQWTTYDEDRSIEETEKARLLEQCLTGKALESIADIPFSNNIYQNRKNRLEERYGNKNRVITLRRAELRKISGTTIPTNFNADVLRNVMDKVSSQILSLQDLGVEEVSYAEETTNSLLQSFPKFMTTRWRLNWGENHLPSLKDVLKNIGKEARILESEEISRSVQPQEEEKKERPREPYTPCFTCKSTLQNPHQCKAGTPEERKKKYIDAKRCLKCLYGVHPTETCTNSRRCTFCSSTEHSMAVCNTRPRPTPSVTCTNKTEGTDRHRTGILPTFTAYIEQNDGTVK